MSIADAKQILTDYSSPAFHVFYMSFSSMENAIRERGIVQQHFCNVLCCLLASRGRTINDQLRELMEVILPSLEVFYNEIFAYITIFLAFINIASRISSK